MYICTFLEGSVTRISPLSLSDKPTYTKPPENRKFSGLWHPSTRLVNPLKMYLHQHSFPPFLPRAHQGTTDPGNRSRTTTFSSLVSFLTLSDISLLLSFFEMSSICILGHVEQMLSLAGGVSVPSYRKVWGHEISSILHYLCVNPLFYVFLLFYWKRRLDNNLALYQEGMLKSLI